MGGFILIDRITNATVGAGLLHFALRRSARTSTGRRIDVDKAARAAPEGPAALRRLVHRALGGGQVDHRQHGRAQAPRDWAATPTCSTATTSATA